MKTQNTAVVVTGSVAQVPPEIASQLGMVILPLTINVAGKDYLDGIDIFPGELYQKMRTQKLEVKTAAPSVGQYYECFKRIIDQKGCDVLCITLSRQLSSGYNAAVVAAQMISNEHPMSKVIVFDSLLVAAPQGLLAIEAAKQLQAGLSLEEVVQYLTNARHRSGLLAALDSLDYLAQGGRIGKAAYLVGSALQIIPILSINKEGIVAPSRVVRNKENVIPAIISILTKQTSGFKKLDISVTHADAQEKAEALKQSLNECYPSLEIPISDFSPVMGAHTGPGLIGLGYLFE
ncbi:MAG: DegV family protein [Chloroflexi bacterium]|nr:DegV family protein [Chloroflexota bacterium]